MPEQLQEANLPTNLSQLERQIYRKLDIYAAKVLKLEAKVSKIYDSMTIDYEQQEKLNKLAKQSVINQLGGKNTPAYEELSKKAFSAIWTDFKLTFNVKTYKNTAVRDFEIAENYLENWKPKRDLELMIIGANSQLGMRG